MAKFKRWYVHVLQLSLGRMNRAPIATFLFFFFILLSFPLFTHAAQVILAWDASTDPGVAGYKVYYGTSSGNYQVVIDVGKNTGCTISNLQNGSTYYFSATDYSTSGVESGHSNEVLFSAPGTPIVADTTAPTVTQFGIPQVSSSLTISITAFTATDNVGVTGYLLTESATAPSAAAAGWSPSPPGTYRFTTAGSKTLYAWAKDAAGNVSASLSVSVTVTTPPTADTTAPTVTAFTIPASSTALTVSITTFTATDNVGVTGYQVTETATAPAASAAGWSATRPPSYAFAAAGAKVLYAWAKDAAGNVSASRNAQVNISPTDTTRPIVSGFAIPSTAASLTISITAFTATDNVGVTGYLLTESATAPSAAVAGWSPSPPGTYRFTAAGAKTLYAWAKDAAGNVSASLSASVTIISINPALASVPAIIGVYRGGAWYWDKNGNRIWDGCGADTCINSGSFGLPADIPVAGDWSGNGVLKIGVYRQGQWYLDKNGNGVWNGCGVDTCIDSFGIPTDIPVAGDWTGTGVAKIGVYRQGQWFLDKNGNGVWDGCGVDTCIQSFGLPTDIPVVGDWTGTGIAKIGVYRQGHWYLDKNGNGVWDGCGVDTCIESFGLPADIPVVGDWTGTGTDRIGVYRQGHWYQDNNGNGVWDGCGVDTCIDSFGGNAGDIPFTK